MSDFATNEFAKKYSNTLKKREESRHAKKAKSQALSERKYHVGTKDEYPKKFRKAYVEAVGIYNKNHPE